MSNPKQSPLIGLIWYLFAIVAGIATLIGVSTLIDSYGGDPGPGVLIAALGVGAFFWSFGRRHFAELGETVLANDKRPPIVYLRSFKNEGAIFDEEYAFSKMFENIGPFVAIGEPGERLPPLGAARLYVADDEWQFVISELIARARMVIVFGGSTPGLGWELNHLKEKVDPRKLAIIMPKQKATYETFSKLCLKHAGLSLPNYPTRKQLKYSSNGIAGFVAFNPHWQPDFIALPKVKGRGYGVNVYGDGADGRAWAALAIICERIGVVVEKPPRNWFVSIYVGFMKLAGIIFFFVILPLLLMMYFDILVDDGNGNPTFDWSVLKGL